ncbi:hypothetical protein J4Q44_G00270490 [Coregonus suidteri]|uniref:Uncharacterized protein n=1 Tax=Coregonus suidteri TaxID=861788 RepID=A0AAN8KWY0_9TELE
MQHNHTSSWSVTINPYATPPQQYSSLVAVFETMFFFYDLKKNKNINTTCERSQTFSIHTKSLFLSNVVHKSVNILVSEHFSFAKIIHPPDRCGILRS